MSYAWYMCCILCNINAQYILSVDVLCVLSYQKNKDWSSDDAGDDAQSQHWYFTENICIYSNMYIYSM